MSKERKFHEWLEQQNREEKDRVWAKIQQKETERLASSKQEDGKNTEKKSAPLHTRPISWRKWATIAASSLAAVVLGVFAVVKFFPFDGNVTTSSSSSESEGGGRYFTNQSYEAIETSKTLKAYAQEIGKNLLYFDWYAETDYYKNQIWCLKDTQEIICFNEEIIDINTGCRVFIFLTEAETKVEALDSDEETDRQAEIKEVKIGWGIQDDNAIANFQYQGYKYYLRVKEPIDENYILTLIEELLS